ncbi:pyruvate, phosphate dikinase [bacterium]|nr:pyruvate, phosphate dikinase [bacterium]MBU1072680.1 pyruvate, phosphate dikinase [bacterium]
MAEQQVFFFGNNEAEGGGDQKALLGGKGANLAEMDRIGIPVPPGFTITTECCIAYLRTPTILDKLRAEVEKNIAKVEKVMHRRFADPADPLLFSCRSGAKISMPGMMDTVLNIGLNDQTVKGLIAKSGNERFGYDSYRRLVQMYGDVVMGVEGEKFEDALDTLKEKRGVALDTELTVADLRGLIATFKKIVKEDTGREFPTDPMEQLWGSIEAVFRSWNVPRAISYRNLNRLPHDMGTAVNVQTMVFGNMGDNSATGVAFTRNPSSGENFFYGEFLVNAQGEDVVAGTRTPQALNNEGRDKLPAGNPIRELPTLEGVMPEAYATLCGIRDKLEKHYHDMEDIEFTIQDGRLWMLQTRHGKRTGSAAVRIAAEMESEGLMSVDEALLAVGPEHLDQLLHDQIDPKAEIKELGKGLPASPGAAQGEIVFSAVAAVAAVAAGRKVVLVRRETSPEDIEGMHSAEGILTARGGMTSHAAVVARGMGKPCVAGCGELKVSYQEGTMQIGGKTFKAGDLITIDGTQGIVIDGKVPLVAPSLEDPHLKKVMEWADARRRLGVRTNADTPHDSEQARTFGAAGIGLCRTEHMFFGEDRIKKMREMILADDEAGRRKALTKILPLQQADFEGIFTAMDGFPVTVRLLDPPLHEFLPSAEQAAEIKELADELGVSVQVLKERIESLHEMNPMLGHRGCRLGLTYPEVYETQVEAIIRAALAVKSRGVDVQPEIMIPLIGTVPELAVLRELSIAVAKRVMEEVGAEVDYLVGTMIEIPRAALLADKIAEVADFFSFGTNDLTQMTFGYSRDDAGVFLPEYVSKGILPSDPFQQLDQEGVGQLVAMAVEKGRKANSHLHLGICGEHGGDPSSVDFCHRVGLDYVSCSPFRVPIARLAAAHAAIRNE